MGEDLDQQTLDLVVSLLPGNAKDGLLVRGLWADRAKLVIAMVEIRDWDMGHSEALSVQRVQLIVQNALVDVGEEQ